MRLTLPALFLAATMTTEAGANGHGMPVPDSETQQRLVSLVRQDCGSCHGLRLTGGLGPALTPEALAHKPADLLVETILRGRPGTAMPGWQGLMSEAEARWVAQVLRTGFPDKKRSP